MVKNQNWQKRVETADARRKEAKQKKQYAADKKLYKQWAQEWLAMMERHVDRLETIMRIDIWSDKQVSFSVEEKESVLEDHPVRVRRRLRAVSMDSSTCSNSSSGKALLRRGRSNSVSESKKKSHLRSLHSFHNEDVLLCKSHFFTTTCSHEMCGKKGGGCKYVHFPTNKKTLCQAVKDTSIEQLVLSRQAASLDDDDEASPGAMDMVYHVGIDISTMTSNETVIHEKVSGFLSSNQISLASLVYIVMDGVLVYDRNREGLVGKVDVDFLLLVLGQDAMQNRRFSIASENNEGSQETLINFPGAVLEHILTFLPDAAVPAACRVCQPWHAEIGRHSANLWRHMLQRRNWPLPTIVNGLDDTEASRHVFRNDFTNHYAVIRDVAAIQKALTAITFKKTVEEKEMTYQDFSKRRHAPSTPNACVSIQVWSPNHVLAAYSQDCSLRLFESSARGGGSDEKQCRELVCQSIDPYRNTRRRSCCIIAMGLDEDYIGCLCHVASDDLDMNAYNLVVQSRDDFLLGESSSDADLNLAVIDIGQAVVNFLLSANDVDHRLLVLADFFTDGGEIDEIDVIASSTLATCGSGRFMVEVSISIPDDNSDEMHLLDRKLVLFSAQVGAVLWVGESNPLTQPLRPALEDMIVTSIRRPGLDSICTVAVGSVSSSYIAICEIDTTGHVQIGEDLRAPPSISSKLKSNEGWDFSLPAPFRRSILITSSYVITGDIMVRIEEEQILERRSLISFHPRHPGLEESACATVEIPGDTEVIRMACLRDQHILILSRAFADAPDDAMADREGGGGGHWFRGDRPASGSTRMDIYAFIYHIETRCQIGRYCLLEDVSSHAADVPCITVDSGDTLGVGLSWNGLVMTGNDVRSVGDSTAVPNESTSPRSSGKKKRNGRAKRRAKKDEFARGMRQNSG